MPGAQSRAALLPYGNEHSSWISQTKIVQIARLVTLLGAWETSYAKKGKNGYKITYGKG
jgi:hypothetical protein